MDRKVHQLAALFQKKIIGIESLFVLCKERAKRGQSEGKERAKRGKPHLTLSLPSLYPLLNVTLE